MIRLHSRKAWGAKPATSITLQKRNTIHTLVVHHTAGRAAEKLNDVKQELRAIQRMHMEHPRNYSDIGYNFIIDRAGRIWVGRGFDRVGAHTLNHNTGTIGVAFMGNYEHIELNRRQLAAFAALRTMLRLRGIKIRKIKGHRQMPDQNTACPGKNIVGVLV